jgi:hypothetical protein
MILNKDTWVEKPSRRRPFAGEGFLTSTLAISESWAASGKVWPNFKSLLALDLQLKNLQRLGRIKRCSDITVRSL